MALLTNADLIGIISSDIDEPDEAKLIVNPFDKGSLTPVGYDLRVGKNYVVDGEEKGLEDGDYLRISPRNIALIHTLEEIRMPRNKSLSAIINSKVSLSCKGLSNISTTVDADWKGSLLIAVHNNSNKEIKLKFKDAFCTILFMENKSPATEGRHAKPNGRSDILKDAFKKNTKASPIVTTLINAVPPAVAVLGLYFSYRFFKESPYLIGAMTAVSVFVASYITKFVDAAISFMGRSSSK
ncbi:hypothetical protein HA520_18270 [Azotobacter chroococcum]|uniref:dUTPase-like domain-containing protein n=1 Tax=Azotobacter chroococcum TaxID=353 RepID=A0AA44C869_9GAMM|nr:hypothetical protein [Azotobacter chroococcum]NHN79204.1 hypothetical protein [Azotobacter chroococcum]